MLQIRYLQVGYPTIATAVCAFVLLLMASAVHTLRTMYFPLYQINAKEKLVCGTVQVGQTSSCQCKSMQHAVDKDREQL